jgi:hypothetical protein
MNNQLLQNFSAKLKTAAKSLKIIAVVFLVIVLICYAIYAFFRFSYIKNKDTALDKINSTVLTLADVMGKNLPKMPDQEINNSTIAGIDANNNMVRDDVELAIFEKYPDSAKMRAALLQYAQALQLELTAVNSEEVMKNALVKDSKAYNCIVAATNYNENDGERETYNSVLNTEIRKNHYEVVYKKYMISFTLADQGCDIDLSTLPN